MRSGTVDVRATASRARSARDAGSAASAVSASSGSILAITGRHHSRRYSPLRFRRAPSSGERQDLTSASTTRLAERSSATTAPSKYRKASARRTGLLSSSMMLKRRFVISATSVGLPRLERTRSGHAETVTTLFGSCNSAAAANASLIARSWASCVCKRSATAVSAWHRYQGSAMSRANSKAA